MYKKEQIKNNYNELAGILTTLATHLSQLTFNNPKLEEARLKMVKGIEDEADKIKKEANEQLDAVVWDKLVIAFFGETNAGKSTIIESLRILLNEESREMERHRFSIRNLFHRNSLRKTDGLIVGDGRQDFTQDYHEYNMTVNGHPFVLIDVPGIEGNEAAYTEGITRALAKGHCVFYVNGGETTNEATAKKIISYLNEWVKVNVIYNVRDNVDAYEFEEDRVSLMTDRVKKSVQILDHSFRNYLGQHFEGVIPVQGLLAMSSHADFSPKRPDLIKVQQRLLSMFSEELKDGQDAAEEIRIFSNIMDLVKIIDQKSLNFTEEIRTANMLKLSTFGRRIYHTVRAHINEDGRNFENYSRIIKNFRSENESIAENAAQMFQRSIKNGAYRLLEELRKVGYKKIERSNFKALENLFKDYKTNLEILIKDEANKTKAKFANDIKSSAGKLTEIPGVSINMIGDISFGNFDMPLPDTQSIANADDIQFKDVFQTAGSAVGGAGTGAAIGGFLGSIIPGLGTAIGAWIGGAIGGGTGLVGGSISAGEEQTRRAKQMFDKQLEKQKTATETVCRTGGDKVRAKLSSEIKRINNRTQRVDTDINRYIRCLNDATKNINNFIARISQ